MTGADNIGLQRLLDPTTDVNATAEIAPPRRDLSTVEFPYGRSSTFAGNRGSLPGPTVLTSSAVNAQRR